MYLANPVAVTTRPLSEYERQFAICESCSWCATMFQKIDISNNNDGIQQHTCPVCKNKGISMIPLAKDEGYTIAMKANADLK